MSDKAMLPGTFMLTRSTNLQNILNSSFVQKLQTQARLLINQKSYEILVGSFLAVIFGDAFSRALIMAVLPLLQNTCITLTAFFKNSILHKVITGVTLAYWSKGR